MNRNQRIGLTVLLALGLGYGFLSWVKGAGPFNREKLRYVVVFENVNGLKVGDPVTVSGLQVGRVNNIQLVPGGAAVNLSLGRAVALRRDAQASVLIKEVLSGKQVSIKPGKAAEELPPGDTLQGEPTFDFTVALSRIGRVVEQLEPGVLNRLLVNLDQLTQDLSGVVGALEPQTTGELVQRLNRAAASLEILLAQVQRYRLAPRTAELFTQAEALGRRADTALQAFTRLSGKVEALTPTAEASLQHLQTSLQSADTLLAELTQLSQSLNQEGTLVHNLLNDRELAPKFNYTLDNLNRTLEHIRTHKVHVRMSLSPKQKTFEDPLGQDTLLYPHQQGDR